MISGRISVSAMTWSGVMAQSTRWMRLRQAILGRYLRNQLAESAKGLGERILCGERRVREPTFSARTRRSDRS
jgi:hypothetical protein